MTVVLTDLVKSISPKARTDFGNVFGAIAKFKDGDWGTSPFSATNDKNVREKIAESEIVGVYPDHSLVIRGKLAIQDLRLNVVNPRISIITEDRELIKLLEPAAK